MFVKRKTGELFLMPRDLSALNLLIICILEIISKI